MKSGYQSGKEVLFKNNNNQPQNGLVSKTQVKQYGLCPKKNYIINEEDYVFLSGTVRPPFKRQFEMQGVT